MKKEVILLNIYFQAPRDEMFAWSANLEGKAGENKSNSDFARALKYHQIWSYAHSVRKNPMQIRDLSNVI